MFGSEGTNSLLRKILSRVAKAIVRGLLWFVSVYILPMLIVSYLSKLAPSIFKPYGFYLDMFIFIILFFVVATELLSGTIFQHALSIAEALILMVFFVYALSGGIITVDVANAHVVVDLRIYLVMLLTIDFLGLAKDVLQAINFLSENAEI